MEYKTKKYSFYLTAENQEKLEEVKKIMLKKLDLQKPQQSAIINKAISNYCDEYLKKNS
ncbi:hypothetical protein [Lactococcus lactis]|uniref:hypothetical protein n=1 Tax=Lactococcus lactis TaxID=1358 RepID=UPI00163D5414|nr:hypothetical protein [Lactococcus lactis]MBR8673592.1 hypothetical protein [Lactococcus lactis subsp. lactis]MBR8676505.1 hypothetical protein [Lactococcus lactis subsp. lactis]MBR8683990.1 hypothetical protein [Lactococcus lactis subsp. lactis]MCH5427454.1 hypothetical protein [Lactococcus lactis]MDT2859710.1 hypothetical protein [Lactococcus lactis]